MPGAVRVGQEQEPGENEEAVANFSGEMIMTCTREMVVEMGNKRWNQFSKLKLGVSFVWKYII